MLLLIVASFIIIGVVDEMSCRRKKGNTAPGYKASSTPKADEVLREYRTYMNNKEAASSKPVSPQPVHNNNKSYTPSWRK